MIALCWARTLCTKCENMCEGLYDACLGGRVGDSSAAVEETLGRLALPHGDGHVVHCDIGDDDLLEVAQVEIGREPLCELKLLFRLWSLKALAL